MGEWVLAGYVTLRELGRGGFGRVVLARHEASGTLVAIKYLTTDDERFRTEFRAEAAVLHRLENPYVVRLFEYAEGPRGAAIVMEAIDGVSLRAMLDERGPLDPEAALVVLKGSLLGLGAAHRAGVVHRDYKPANVMVRDNGQSKLIDFGIARRSGASGDVIGTPAYMAPEQWTGAPASPSTDVYAATCVFFECVTGRRPFAGHTTDAYRAQHMSAPIPADAAPPQVRELVRRGLAKHPAQRPQGALEFAAELESVAVAAYGPQWERTGWRRLGEAAAGLAALFPLAALAGGTASGGAAVGQVAGVAGRGALGKVLGSGAGVKAAAVITGVVVVAATGAAVVATTKGSKKPLSVRLVSYTQPVAGVDLAGARYVQVDHARNPAVQRGINDALRAPLDWSIGEVRKLNTFAKPPCTKPTTLGAKPEIGVRNKRLLSVRYELPLKPCFPSDSQLPHANVTVDLQTGKALTADDMFRPQTLTPAGLNSLYQQLKPRIVGPPQGPPCVEGPPRRQDFFPGRPRLTTKPGLPYVSPFFTPKAMSLMWSDGGSECPYYAIDLPYTQARPLLTPRVTGALPG